MLILVQTLKKKKECSEHVGENSENVHNGAEIFRGGTKGLCFCAFTSGTLNDLIGHLY